MKIFTNETACLSNKTFIVSELKRELNKYPDELPVLLTWEGTENCIDSGSFTVAKNPFSFQEGDYLMIEAENSLILPGLIDQVEI